MLFVVVVILLSIIERSFARAPYSNPLRVGIVPPNGNPVVPPASFNPGLGRPSLPGDYDSLEECCAPKCCGSQCCGPTPVRPNPTMPIPKPPAPRPPQIVPIGVPQPNPPTMAIGARRPDRPQYKPNKLNPVRPRYPGPPPGHRAFARRLSGTFQVHCEIVGKRVTWFQINLGISFIWDRYSVDYQQWSLLPLPYLMEATNLNAESERLIYIASNQAILIGDFLINDVSILISENPYTTPQALGQIGFGKRSRFAESVVIFKSFRGPMGIAFNATGYDAYCVDGTILTPLRLSRNNDDQWKTRGRISVGNEDERRVSRPLTIRIESIHDFVELHNSTFAKFKQDIQQYCRLDIRPEYMMARNCTCTDLIRLAPLIRYDFSNSGSIIVYPDTYLEPTAHEHNCVARVQLQSEEGVLIAGRPFLESAVTVMNTADHNDPKISVCQSKY